MKSIARRSASATSRRGLSGARAPLAEALSLRMGALRFGAAPVGRLVPASLPSRAYGTAPAAAKPLFDKILIANRGEIACRVMRTANALGIKTVAVYSEADKDSMHVKMADEAYWIGPAPSNESYLRADRIIEICKKTGAQAVHPGYGFLSENAAFSQSLHDAGIVFIGPPASAIVSMGSKSESKDIMLRAGVPCVPGFHPSASSDTAIAATQTLEFLQAKADEIGYPVLIKAVSGGGGKGMKIVTSSAEFAEQLESAKREAAKSFGDDVVLLEKYLTTPRHVEVQIFSDTHGNHVSLFERDCSVQRRHQKIIEEAPAPGLPEHLREDLFDKARKAAAAVDYVGAGTVEFIMDAENPENFYFMEMNTRLQVEHPVTEAVTNVDLVQWQLEVAAGNAIPLSQSEITCTGHAFECRIYAESPRNNFLPATGLLQHVRAPTPGAHVRMETGFTAGDDVSVFYDPMIAKLIVKGADRTEALRILRVALADYQIVGPETNLAFLQRLASHPAFVAGDVETGFIPKHFAALFAPETAASPELLAQVGLYLAEKDAATRSAAGGAATLLGFRVAADPAPQTYTLHAKDAEADAEPIATVDVQLTGSAPARATVTVAAGGTTTTFAGAAPQIETQGAESTLTTLFDGERKSVVTVVAATTPSVLDARLARSELHVFSAQEGFRGAFELRPPAWKAEVLGAGQAERGSAVAPMPSRIVQVHVAAGDSVTQGTPLVTVEAMKTEHVLRAPEDGIVKRVVGAIGELVPQGKVLVEFEESE